MVQPMAVVWRWVAMAGRSRRWKTRSLVAGLFGIGCSGGERPPTSVEPPVATVEIQPPSATTIFGEQALLTRLKAVVKDASGRELTDRVVAWTSSDPTRVTVIADGPSAALHPVALGTAMITATVEGKSGQSAVRVRLPDGLFAWPDTSRIPVSATRPLALRPSAGYHVAGNRYPVSSWESSDPSVATVGSDGLVTAVGVGHATITGRADDRAFTAEVFTFRYPTPLRFASVSSDGEHTCALTTDGVAYCWGQNGAGQLANDEIMDRCATYRTVAGHLSKVDKFRCSEAPVPVSTNLRFASISAAGGTTCAVTASGAAYCWGRNGATGTGVGDPVVRTPTPVAGGITFRRVSVGGAAACGVSMQDVAYCWGDNFFGALGNGSRLSSPTPVQVAGNLSWRSVIAGGTSCGVTTADVAYCWGSNWRGQAGSPPSDQICGGTTCFTTPVRVVSDQTFSRVEAGTGFTCGLVTDGRVYCWGEQRGPVQTMTHVPTLVPGELRFVSLHARGGPCGVTADGATYCWNDLRTVDGQYETPVRRIPQFPLRALSLSGALSGTHCGIDLNAILYCWDAFIASNPFWSSFAWSVFSPTPVRVHGQ
jgi:hypothetical protein